MNDQKLATKLHHAQLRLQAIQDALTTEIREETGRLVPVFPSGPDPQVIRETVRRAENAERELRGFIQDLECLQPAQSSKELGKRLSEVALMRLKAAEGALVVSQARVQVLEGQVRDLQASREAARSDEPPIPGIPAAATRDEAIQAARAIAAWGRQGWDARIEELRLRQATQLKATGLEARCRELYAEVGYQRHVGLQEVQLLVPGSDADHTTWIVRGRQEGLDCLKAQGREEGRQQERVRCIEILENLGCMNVRAVLDPSHTVTGGEASRG